MRSTLTHARILQSLDTSLAGKVPGRFAGSDVGKIWEATWGALGGDSAAQVPWTLGKWCLGLQHRADAGSGRHAMGKPPSGRWEVDWLPVVGNQGTI